MHPESRASCANCEAELVGTYCHRCGQRAVERRVPLARLIADVLGDLVGFDSRLGRTLPPLLTRPGLLSREWSRGRRAAYVPPLRLYLFVAALFFLGMAVTDVRIITLTATGDDGRPLAQGSDEAAAARRDRDAPAMATDPTLADRFGAALLAAWQRDPDDLQDTMIDRTGRLSLLLAPVSALLLAGLYRRRRLYLVEHVVFTLHLHAFGFLVLTLVLLVPREGAGGMVLRGLAITVLFGYLLLALDRFYGGRRLLTAIRGTVFVLLYVLVVLLPTVLLALLWVVWLP